MSTIAVFNGFGSYEQTPGGQRGITLTFGGVPFWLPYDKVTYFPDYTMREVDHEKLSPPPGEEGILQYKALRQSGEVIVDTLLEMQIPYKNSDKGIIVIANEPAKRKSTSVRVAAGYEENGRPIFAEVQEIEPSEFEVKEAHRKAEAYKKEIINDYLQSKRERISGGTGRTSPAGLTKVFMDEYGINDIDSVSKSMEKAVAANPGMTPEMFVQALQMVLDAQKPTAEAKSDTGKKLVASPV